MATATIECNGDKTCNWTMNASSGETYHYQCIDEYPSSPDGSYVVTTDTQGTGLEESYYVDTIPHNNVASVTQVVVYTYGQIYPGPTNYPTINISFDGGSSWEGAQYCVLGTSGGETSNTWGSLSKSKSQLDNLVLKYVSDCPSKGSSNRIDRVYIVVTYNYKITSISSYMGVSINNLNSINGIPIYNISTIKGV